MCCLCYVSLSIIYHSSVGCIKHYLIVLDSNTHEVTIDGVKYFSTLPDLVEVIKMIELNND